MEVIQSFTIDHTRLKPGIYVSREDKGFTTYDLRITTPNQEPAVAPAAMHSIEHLMATWFRNSAVKDDVYTLTQELYDDDDGMPLYFSALWLNGRLLRIYDLLLISFAVL